MTYMVDKVSKGNNLPLYLPALSFPLLPSPPSSSLTSDVCSFCFQSLFKPDSLHLCRDFSNVFDNVCMHEGASYLSDVKCVFLTANDFLLPPPWGTAGAETENPSVGNPELKGSPFKACSRSEYSHACFTYCQGFLR